MRIIFWGLTCRLALFRRRERLGNTGVHDSKPGSGGPAPAVAVRRLGGRMPYARYAHVGATISRLSVHIICAKCEPKTANKCGVGQLSASATFAGNYERLARKSIVAWA